MTLRFLGEVLLFDPDQVALAVPHLGPAFEADDQFHRRTRTHDEHGLALTEGASYIAAASVTER
jgi:hypothetical protein